MEAIEAIVRQQLAPASVSSVTSTDDIGRDGDSILRIWVEYNGDAGKPSARQMIDATDQLAISPMLNGRIPVVSFVDAADTEAPLAAE